jgi:hypothetical protein
MSATLRRTGIFVYLLATIALYGIGHQDLFWLSLILGVVYLMLCGHVEKHLVRAARARHKQIRDSAVQQGMSREELERFNNLPPRISGEDYSAVPVQLAFLSRILFATGCLLLISAIIFRLFF